MARHNVLLESEEAKKASQELFEEEAIVSSVADIADNNNQTKVGAGAGSSPSVSNAYEGAELSGKSVLKVSGLEDNDENDGDDEKSGGEEEEDEGEINETEGKRPLDEENDNSRSKRRKL